MSRRKIYKKLEAAERRYDKEKHRYFRKRAELINRLKDKK
jgi:hypothetical protein